MTTDWEIAKQYTLKPIEEIAAKVGISEDELEKYGKYKAKISKQDSYSPDGPRGKLIMVTAMSPTPAGEGKTLTSIGLADSLNRLGKKAVVALREPSLGPVFGMKGKAAKKGK